MIAHAKVTAAIVVAARSMSPQAICFEGGEGDKSRSVSAQAATEDDLQLLVVGIDGSFEAEKGDVDIVIAEGTLSM